MGMYENAQETCAMSKFYNIKHNWENRNGGEGCVCVGGGGERGGMFSFHQSLHILF